MFKYRLLLGLALFGSLQGMDQEHPAQLQENTVNKKLKQFVFWYFNSMPAVQGVVESSEIVKELYDTSSSQLADAPLHIDPVITYVQTQLEELNMPACQISIKEQSKPLVAGYTSLVLNTAYHSELRKALLDGTIDKHKPLLQYHLYRASIYMNSYIKPKFIALTFALPALTGTSCYYINQFLPQDGLSSWLVMLLESYATTTVQTGVIQTFLNSMQKAADDAIPNDPNILQAGIDYLKNHRDPAILSRRLGRIAAFKHRLREIEKTEYAQLLHENA